MSSVDRKCEEARARTATVVGGGPCLLADLPPGARATVTEVMVGEAPAVARRLADLGFVPGAVVEVVRRAPLRDPVLYRVQDYEVCLRRSQSARVRVEEVER
ncbi:FeoA family protein [Streptomyces sp. B93]|uniref:FeoA family protein n=1 Tax=Streptomyces sp. B93 TaxID=2824875 RepID=UPI001B36E100|nr:FeoA family protein [Streptomyces sp. B93]MBQ1090005.1 ferrous iron transport protein A [Streptomyces sp. B93]